MKNAKKVHLGGELWSRCLKLTKKQLDDILSLVTQIASCYKIHQNYKDFETKLDKTFYQLYQLTSEECAFINNYLTQYQ